MTVRVGLVGTSWWADAMYLPALADHPRGAITAICGRNADKANDMAWKWSIGQVHTDWLAMLDSGSIDAVIIASTNNTHHPIAMAAMERGLHVLCEKPLGLTHADALELTATAERFGTITMTPFTYRWMPWNRYVKRLIGEGYVGQPHHLDMRYYTDFARDRSYAWRFDADLAGSGIIGDIGTHWLHLAEWFLGPVTHVGAMTSTFGEREPRPDGNTYTQTEDSAVMNVRCESGAYAVLHVTAMAWEGTPFGQTHHLEVHGSEGTLYAHSDWNAEQLVRGVRAGQPGPAKALPWPDDLVELVEPSVHDTYRKIFRTTDAMARSWVDAIADGRQVQPDFAAGARVQAMADAAVASAARGGGLIEL